MTGEWPECVCLQDAEGVRVAASAECPMHHGEAEVATAERAALLNKAFDFPAVEPEPWFEKLREEGSGGS